MATACIYNVYSGTFDRGARVTSVPEKHIEVDVERQLKIHNNLKTNFET